jgi:hypothetical protein
MTMQEYSVLKEKMKENQRGSSKARMSDFPASDSHVSSLHLLISFLLLAT